MYIKKEWKERFSGLKEIIKSIDPMETEGLELKRMVYLPNDYVIFLSKNESDDLMDEFEEIAVFSASDLNLYVVFDDNDVISYKGRRYITGPVVIRTDMDPECEEHLTKEEIRIMLNRLEARQKVLNLSWKDIPALEL